MIIFFLTAFTPAIPALFGFAKRVIRLNRLPLFAFSALLFTVNNMLFAVIFAVFLIRFTYKKIVGISVKLVFINMVNYFSFKKLFTKFLFNHQSMGAIIFPVDSNDKIALRCNTANGRLRISVMPTCVSIMLFAIATGMMSGWATINFTNSHTII